MLALAIWSQHKIIIDRKIIFTARLGSHDVVLMVDESRVHRIESHRFDNSQSIQKFPRVIVLIGLLRAHVIVTWF